MFSALITSGILIKRLLRFRLALLTVGYMQYCTTVTKVDTSVLAYVAINVYLTLFPPNPAGSK